MAYYNADMFPVLPPSNMNVLTRVSIVLVKDKTFSKIRVNETSSSYSLICKIHAAKDVENFESKYSNPFWV